MSNLVQGFSVPSITIGGRVFTDIPNLIILKAIVTAAGQKCTFRLPSGTAGYQVTAAKTLKVLAISAFASNTGSNSFIIAQSDNDAGWTGSTALTNPVYEANNADTTGITAGGIVTARNEFVTNFSVAATKYLSVSGGNGASAASIIYAFCYEV